MKLREIYLSEPRSQVSLPAFVTCASSTDSDTYSLYRSLHE
jgi:hypothetical protein